jgi:hypothetical protein
VNAAVTVRFPPASAEKLGLEVSPDDTYRLSWIELAFRLTQASGQIETASVEIVQRAISAYWLARAAARAALKRPDWRKVSWKTGLLALCDDPQAVSQEAAACYLECFFLAVFTQPERSQDWLARQVRPEHVAGWAYTLSMSDLETLAGLCDERRMGDARGGVCTTILAAALNLYLRWTGQVVEMAQPLELAEPDEMPIPAGVIE